MIRRLLVILFLLVASPAFATTYYVSFTDGSDSNNGTAKATPFKHVPQYHPIVGAVNSCASNCATAGAALAGDDIIVLKGNDTWTTLTGIYRSGTSGHPITYTVDATWYRGGAWSKPIFDMGYSTPINWVIAEGVDYITINNVELAHTSTATHDDGGNLTTLHSKHIVMTNLYVHGWRYTGPCCVNDGVQTSGAMGGVIFGSFDQGDDYLTNTMEDSEIENSENAGTYAGGYSGGMGLAARYIGTMTRVTIHDVSSAVLFTADWNGGTQYNISYPTANDTPDGGVSTHANGVYMLQGTGSIATLRNSVFHDAGSGANMILAEAGNKEVQVYNNILYGAMTTQSAIEVDAYNGGASGNWGTARIYNNLLYMEDSGRDAGWPAILVTNRLMDAGGPVKLQNYYSFNNYCIGSAYAMDNASSSLVNGTLSRGTNLPNDNTCQSAATAIGQGYVQATLWAPVGGRGSTAHAGTDLSTYFTTDILSNTRAAGYWDIGPYQYQGTTYYISTATNTPAGSDSNAGTIAAPFLTFAHAKTIIGCKDTVYFRSGTYAGSTNVIGGRHSYDPVAECPSYDIPVYVRNYPGETVTMQPNVLVAAAAGFDAGSLMPGHVSFYWKIIGDDPSHFILDAEHVSADGDCIGGQHADFVWYENLTCINAPGSGILIGGGDDNTFINMDVHDNGTTGQEHCAYLDGQRALVDGGKYHACAGYGIHVFHSTGCIDGVTNCTDDNIIRNADIYGNGTYLPDNSAGILLSTGFRNLAYNNKIRSNTGPGVQIDFRCTDCALYGNTIYGNSSKAVDIHLGGSVVDTVLKNNIFYNNAGGTVGDNGTGTTDSHNLTTNPSFTNAGAADFTLTVGSSAIAYGTSLSSVCTGDNISICSDIIGVARGTTPDAGAYQYASGTPASISGLSPSTGFQGALVAIAVTGASTNFSNGSTVCTVSGSDIVIVGTTVSSTTAGICTITIGSNATLGARDVTMTTGGEVATATGGFTITLANSRQVQLFRIN